MKKGEDERFLSGNEWKAPRRIYVISVLNLGTGDGKNDNREGSLGKENAHPEARRNLSLFFRFFLVFSFVRPLETERRM